VPNLLGPGEAGVLVGDQANNRVTVQAPSSNGNQYAPVSTLATTSASSAQLAPGDVLWAVLDRGATLPDAIVVGTGSNSVDVYRTTSIKDGAPSFAPSPETYFVGTAPASVTITDINGDGIPDMLIANQGSNDVSVLFGSYNAQGYWVGIPGPRLKSGGDGPIAVAVQDLGGSAVPDLAVFNGGSGTVTVLPGVGRGFFDDRQPATLFNFGSAIVQPPTFVGASGLGYAVTATGNLVRFDLSSPSEGANVVFAGQQVLAAEALASGQVVAALANGDVSLLVPQGNGLTVGSVLAAQAGIPALPSAIEVVSKPGGLVSVLVSSHGSDNIFVFAEQSSSSVAGAILVSAAAPPTPNAFQPSVSAPTLAGVTLATTAIAATASAATASTSSSSASTSSGAVAAVATSSMGLSLGNFSSLGNGSTSADASAVLVPVQGNTYLSVPILDFGSGGDDEQGDGARRMPQLSGMYNFGDTSPLTRFVIGLDEALREYRGWDEATPAEGSGRFNDLWSEDLFRRNLPFLPPAVGPEKAGPSAALPDSGQDRDGVSARFEEGGFAEPQRRRDTTAIQFGAALIDLAGLLVAMRLTSAGACGARRDAIEPGTPVVAKTKSRRRTSGWFALSKAQCR
jgi:hypothetical protein